jgi:hypothetical protein
MQPPLPSPNALLTENQTPDQGNTSAWPGGALEI